MKGLTGYQIFIACPEAAEKLRAQFRAILTEYNNSSAHAKGAVFIEANNWVNARPPNKVKEKIAESDYFILLLGHTLGEAVDVGSGTKRYRTEAECECALEGRKGESGNLLDLVALLQQLTPKQKQDPGEELKRREELRARLAAAGFTITQYKSPKAAAGAIRELLSEWLQAHEKGTSGTPCQ